MELCVLFQVNLLVMYFAMDHPMLPNLSYTLNRMLDAGLVQLAFRDVWASKMERPFSGKWVSHHYQPLRLSDMAPITIFITVFILPVPFLCFGVELVLGECSEGLFKLFQTASSIQESQHYFSLIFT